MPCTNPPILDIADEIVTIINDGELCIETTAERVYIHHERISQIGTDLKVWVQPIEDQITILTRASDYHTYIIDIGILKKCKTDLEVDDVMAISWAIYELLKRYQYTDGGKTLSVTMPTLYSPDYLNAQNLFAGFITVEIVDKN